MATADHESGAKLGSAYIETTVKVADGKQQLKDQLQGYSPVAKEAGVQLGKDIHEGIAGYRPSQGAFDAWAESLADSQLTSVHRAVTGQAVNVLTGDVVARALADGTLKSFESGAAKSTVERAGEAQAKTHADSFLQALGIGMQTGIADVGDKAGDNFATRFLSKTADRLAAGGGVASVFGRVTSDVTSEGEKASEGFFSAFKSKAGGIFSGLGEGIAGFDLGENLKGLKENSKATKEALEGVSEEGAGAAGIIARLASAGELLLNPYVLAGAAILGVLGSLGLVADKLDDLGEKWESTFDQIAIKTGGTQEQVEELGNQVAGIAGNTTLGLDQVGSNVADVSTLFNQTGDNVGKVADAVDKAQQVFGKFDPVSVSRTFDAFNITDADQQIAGIQDLAHGYEAARIPLDQMSASLERIAPAANKFGLNFHDTTGYLTEFAKAGVEPERAALSLTTALEKIRNPKVEKFLAGEGIDIDPKGKGLNAGLHTILDTIKELEAKGDDDSLGKADAIAAKVFGEGQRGGGAAVEQALRPDGGTLDPNNFSAPLNAIPSTVDDLAERTLHAAGAWAEFKNQVDVALKPAGDAIHRFKDELEENIVGFFKAHLHDIAVFFSTLGEAAVRAGQAIVIGLGAAISTLGGIGQGIALLIDGFANLNDSIGTLLQHIPGLEDIGDDMRHGATQIHDFGNEVDGVAKTLQNAGVQAYDFATGPMDDLATSVGGAGDNVKNTNTQFQGLHDVLGELGKEPPPNVEINTDDAQHKADDLLDTINKIKNIDTGTPPVVGPQLPGLPPNVYGGLGTQPNTGGNNPFIVPGITGHAEGGPIWGDGPKGKDSVPIWAAPGEHMWTADEVDKLGGQDAMYHLRAMVNAGMLTMSGFDKGGWVPPGFAVSPGSPDPHDYSSQREWMEATNLHSFLLASGALDGHQDGGVIKGYDKGGWVPPGFAISPGSPDPHDYSSQREWMEAVNLHGFLLASGALEGHALGGMIKGYDKGGWVPPGFATSPGSPDPSDYSSQREWMEAVNLHSFLLASGALDGHEMGGAIRGYEGGGAVGGNPLDVQIADSLIGVPYSKGNRADCSGMVGRIVEGATGIGGGLPTTKNMGPWLAERGFKPGVGGLGQITVGWYDHGPGENDGHAAMTLSNGEAAESGPDNKLVVGGDAHGATASEFDQHMFLPQLWGEGPAGSGGATGAPSAAAVQAAGDKVTAAQGNVDVATQRLQEAQGAPLSTTKDGKLTKGAQESHDKAVAAAQEKLDAANRDLATAKGDQANLLDGSGDPAAVTAAQNALADAKNRQVDAQAKLDAVLADPKHKPSDETAAQNKLAEANTKVAEAQDKLTQAQAKAATSKESKKDQEKDPVDEIGKLGGEFLKDNLPKGFSDPTQWAALKDGSTILKIIGGLKGMDPTATDLLDAGAAGLSGDGGGVATNLAKLFNPVQIPSAGGDPGDVPPGTAGGAGITIDASTNVAGDVGSDAAGQKFMADANSAGTRNIRAGLGGTGLLRSNK